MAETKNAAFDYFYKNDIIEKEFDIKIKKILSLEEQINFCNCVINQVFAGGDYIPAVYDFALRFATLIYYTNIEIKTLSASIMNEAVYQSRAIAYIKERINNEQYTALCAATKEKIEYILQSSYAANNLPNIIGDWVDKLGKQTETLLSNKELLSIVERFKNVDEKDIAHELVKYVKESVKK